MAKREVACFTPESPEIGENQENLTPPGNVLLFPVRLRHVTGRPPGRPAAPPIQLGAHTLNPALARFAPAQGCSLEVAAFESRAAAWLLDNRRQRFSRQTLAFREGLLDRLRWWLNREGCTTVDRAAIAGFLLYVSEGHLEPGGRWGNARCHRPVTPETAHRYHRELATLCRWMEAQGMVALSPMHGMRPPRVPQKDMPNLSADQVDALLGAAAASTHPQRDVAILHFLLDTGIRNGELCALKIADLDYDHNTATIWHGKGDKRRMVVFGNETKAALWPYMQQRCRLDAKSKPSRRARTMARLTALAGSPWLFVADRGRQAGEPLSVSGLTQLLNRLGAVAGLPPHLCHPHCCRHTFAINFLRSKNGDIKTLSRLLGHSSLVMTSKYLSLSEADIASQWEHSPMDARRR